MFSLYKISPYYRNSFAVEDYRLHSVAKIRRKLVVCRVKRGVCFKIPVFSTYFYEVTQEYKIQVKY